MNHEDNTPQANHEIAPELEARIVAWIAGEASAFEISELERLLAEKPELARFKREMESIQQLVNEAMRPDQIPLRLSPERRANLLRAIGVTEAPENKTVKAEPKKTNVVVLPLAAGRRPRPNWWRRGSMIAACVAAGFAIQVMFRNQDEPFDRAAINREKQDGERRKEVVTHEMPLARVPASEPTPEIAFKPARIDVDQATGDPKKLIPGKTAVLGIGSPDKNGLVHFSEKQAQWNAPPQMVDAAPVGDSDVVKLEKFVVTEHKDSTYYASTSTAGDPRVSSRLRINLPALDPGSFKAAGLEPKDALSSNEAPRDAERDVGAGVGNVPLGVTASGSIQAGVAGQGSARSSGYVSNKSSVDLDDQKNAPAPIAFNENSGRVDSDTASASRPVQPPRPNLKKTGEVSNGIVSADAFSDTPSKNVPEFDRLSLKQKDALNPSSEQSVGGKLREVAAISDALKLDQPLARPASQIPAIPTAVESSTATEPVSTFSLHVSDLSFRLAQVALARGEKPDPASIRPEEFYNAFDYGDPTPAMSDKISCRIEQSAHPLLQQRNLVRIAIKVPATGRGASQPLRLTVLLDTSGSMEREDRAASVHRALEVLISLLGPDDRITLIGFARQPRLIAEQLAGDKAGQLLDLLAHTPAEGGTNIEEALKLGTQLAQRQLEAKAQNRIVLLTDGAANLGDANPAQLAKAIEALRQQGIAFDACGVGLDGIDDTMLEALTRKGDGRYYVLNTPEAADAGFAKQLAGAFRPAAENVKVQVRFNPSRVGSYRLIGFDQHRLKEEDFRNDKVDAAELAAEEAAVALYQIEVLPQGEGELGEVYVRFRDAATQEMVERSWTLTYEPHVTTFDRAPSTMQLAGVSALVAEKLRGGPTADAIKLDELAPAVNALRSRYAHDPRVQELVMMFEQMRRMNRD